MNSRILMQGASTLALAATLTGCASAGWHADAGFGSSVRATTASQIIDPGAAANLNPVAGIDGRAARAAQWRYETSFAMPAAPAESMTTGASK